jgi:hypothetical protein
MPLQKLRRSLDDREEIEDKTKRSQGRKENCLVRVATRHARIAVKLGIKKRSCKQPKRTRQVLCAATGLDFELLFFKLTNYFVFGRKLTEIVVQPAVINKGLKLL